MCSFDKGFCQWRNEASEDQFDWSITEGETPSKGTGPMTGFGGSGNEVVDFVFFLYVFYLLDFTFGSVQK